MRERRSPSGSATRSSCSRGGGLALSSVVARPDAHAALEAWVERHGTLTRAAAAHPEVTTLRGRGRVHVVPRPGGESGDERWVVRHYHRGGAVARLLGDRYLRLRTPRPVREFELIRALESLGVPTAPAVGAAVYPGGLFYRGDLVTEWIPDSRDLAAQLFEGSERDEEDGGDGDDGDRDSRAGQPGRGAGAGAAEAAMRAAGAVIRMLHDGGVIHPDLNLKNILIVERGGGPEALVLDLDRASLRGRALGGRARRRMLARFWRSARKWERATGATVPAGARPAFEAGYAEGVSARPR